MPTVLQLAAYRLRLMLLLAWFCISINSSSLAQSKTYWTFDWESIFSLGRVDAGADELKAVVRYAPFFNATYHFNIDFSDLMGMYTGIGVRNVGLISHHTNDNNQLTKIKERSYALGMPLAFRIGDLPDGASFALGAMGELMFAYKRKIFTPDGEKRKIYFWMDERLNLLNASLLAELRFPKGSYLRANYYLRDFFNPDKYRGISAAEGVDLPEYGLQSRLFSISFGFVDELDFDKDDKPKRSNANARKTTAFHTPTNSPHPAR